MTKVQHCKSTLPTDMIMCTDDLVYETDNTVFGPINTPPNKGPWRIWQIFKQLVPNHWIMHVSLSQAIISPDSSPRQ